MTTLNHQLDAERADSTFVGREEVLGELDKALAEALAGHACVRLVAGEAGSGKTTLLAEFARRAQAKHRDVVVVDGTCNAQIGNGDPYAPFRQIVELIAAGEGAAQHQRRLLSPEGWRRLDAIRRHSLQLLLDFGPDLVALFVPGIVALAAKFGVQVIKQSGVLNTQTTSAGAKIFEDNRRNNPIILQYTTFLRKLAALQPVILVVDDLQWVDRASAELFFQLGRDLGGCKVLLVGLYRPNDLAARPGENSHPLTGVINELERYRGEILIDLDRAGAAESQRFVDALLDTEPNRFDAAFRTALHKRTEGHPLFTVELLQALKKTGRLVKDADGYWLPKDVIDWEKLPARIEGVINGRIAQITDELKAILLVASVEGEEFTAQVIAGVEKIDELNLLRRLSQELERRHQIVHEQGEVEVAGQVLARFQFVHALFQRYFYQDMGAGMRRSLHVAIGEVLEDLYGGENDAIVLQLARHFNEGGAWAKALTYYLRAGEKALQIYACADAVHHFQAAMACANHLKERPLPQLCQAQQGIGEALTISGQLEAGREHLLRAYADFLAANDTAAAAHSCRWLAHNFENDGEFDEALTWVARGLAALGDQITAEAVQLRLVAGLIRVRRGEVAAAADEAATALAAAQTLGDPYAQGRALLLQAVVELQRGHNTASLQLAQQGLAIYQRVNDLAGQATAANQLANAYFNLGRWAEAEAAYRQAQATFAHIGDLYNRAFIENNLGEIALHQGRLDDALSFYQAALRNLQASGGSPYAVGVLHNNLGAVFVRRRELTLAREQLQASLDCFAAAKSRDIFPEVHRHLAEIAWQEGDLVGAERLAGESLALAQELEAANEAAITQRLLGELALARADLPTAASQLQASVAALEELDEAYQAACTHLALARLALAKHEPAAARAELDRCGPVFVELGAAPELTAVEQLWRQVAH